MNFFAELGDYTTPFFIVTGSILALTIIKGKSIWNQKDITDVSIRLIWVLGLISFILSLAGYVYEIRLAFEAIEQAGDIQPSLVARGIKEALIIPIAGIFILVFSIGLWATLAELKRMKVNSTKINEEDIL
ncbi:MotA/TolQ/ExbB proton channel family protein [Marinigracilibium pacificum]|uniref:MotA/TolQ/ExbB proton channel domain-containing protein n=1 Tax=Marinigracilibium pacificum TaxID=2729599 RepID=A0A848ISU0_9BACT|nr:hypothetical protein [Marinigracilibium pacificum]